MPNIAKQINGEIISNENVQRFNRRRRIKVPPGDTVESIVKYGMSLKKKEIGSVAAEIGMSRDSFHFMKKLLILKKLGTEAFRKEQGALNRGANLREPTLGANPEGSIWAETPKPECVSLLSKPNGEGP
jgi:hypothetical protein